MTALPESAWENDALETLAEPLGWRPAKGEEVAPGTGERDTWDDLLIQPRLLEALRRLNPAVPGEYLQQALAEIAANRFGHPAPDVLQRYRARQIAVVESSRCGAARWSSSQPGHVACERDTGARYWQHRMVPRDG